jgi:xanthosine utilization system XapX-like protein
MITALVGLIGILLGGVINEYFRRKNRVEPAN